LSREKFLADAGDQTWAVQPKLSILKKLNNPFYPGKQPPDITMIVTRYSPIQEMHCCGTE
jgi:hypothetical protein